MQLKKISLQNIRSYEQQEIQFPQGSTLLSGDIGAGKTSVLLAIEFALFGLQPGQRGSALLRNSARQGKVIMEFEVDGKQIIIERTLKKSSKTISQDYCAITIDNEKQELAVTELKNKVLELLNYPKEFSKKQNLLYKFTVYTPQEQMKQIILQDPETRINTLRHVFGVDKYKKILENTSILTSKLREEKRLKEGMITNIEQDKADLQTKQQELKTKKQSLVLIKKELLQKKDQRAIIQQEQEQISKKINEKIKLQQEIEKSNLMILTKQEAISSNKKIIEQLNQQIQELQKLEFDSAKLKQFEQKLGEIKNQKPVLEEKNLQVAGQLSSLNLKIQENQTIKQKISRLEICPTCLQDVDATYKANVVNKLDNNTSENTKKIASLGLEKKQISEKLHKIDYESSEIQKQIQELNLLKVKLQGIDEKQVRTAEIEKSNIALEKDTKFLTEQTELLTKSVFELKKFDSLFEEKQKQLDHALEQERSTEIKFAELKKEIDLSSVQIQELKQKIQQTQQIQKQLEYITSLEDWLSKKFTPVISHIEKNVMVKLKSEFSKLFSEWFLMLVSDNFHVQLDDNFTPIIEQQDYEIDYAYLSGGERTAIALAYRLSLNQVINSLLSKIKTRDLVILDEPTDGFSAQQLDKMRDVLQELNVKQLIIVSHEQKIEGFVENVIRLKKEGGMTLKE